MTITFDDVCESIQQMLDKDEISKLAGCKGKKTVVLSSEIYKEYGARLAEKFPEIQMTADITAVSYTFDSRDCKDVFDGINKFHKIQKGESNE